MAGRFIDATLRLIDNFTRPMADAMSQMSRHSGDFIKAGKQIERAGKSIQNVGKTMTAAITTPIAGLGITAVKTAADFESAMDSVAAVMGKNLKKGELNDLTEKAEELGKKMKYSASDSAGAFLLLSQAGWDAGKMMENIEGMMYLAGATGTDLAAAANYVVSAMSGLGEESGYTAEIIGNNLARAANSSKTNIDQMGEAFSMVSTTVGQMGYSMEDACVVLGTLANANFEGSEAGMAFNRIIERMSTNDAAVSKLEELGIAMYDEAGMARDLSDVFDDLRGAYAGLATDEERLSVVKKLGGQYSTKLQAILGAEQKSWDGLTEAMSDTNGACKEMYDTANDNFNGRLTILGSTIESIAITFGERLLPYVEKGVGKLQELAEKFSSLGDEQVDQIIHWAAMAAAAGPLVMIFGKTTGSIGQVITKFGILGKSLPTIVGRTQKAGEILKNIKFMPKIQIPGMGILKNAFGGIGKIAGVALKPFATVGRAIGGLIGKSRLLGMAGKGIGKYFGAFGKIVGKVLGPFKRLGGIIGGGAKALFTFLGPANSVILILGALVVAGIAVYKNWDKLVKMAKKVGNYIKSVFEACGFDFDFFKSKVDSSGEKFWEFAEKAQEMWVTVKPYLEKAGELFKVVFEVYLGAAIGAAIGLFGSLFQSATEIFSGITTALGGLMDFITGIFTGNWTKAWNGVKDIFSGVFSSLVALAKAPINGVISIINGAIAGINKMGIKIPDWIPKLGGKEFKINIPQIPKLYRGTNYWQGGPAMIHDKGAEIVDLPRGTRVYPHDKSIQMARQEGGNGSRNVYIAKLADTIIIRETADVDEVMEEFVKKLEQTEGNIATA